MDGILKKCIDLEYELFLTLNDDIQVITKKGYLITTNLNTIYLLCKHPINRQYIYIGQDFITFEKKQVTNKDINLLITQSYLLCDWDDYTDIKVFYTYRSFYKYIESFENSMQDVLLVISEKTFIKYFEFIAEKVHINRLFFHNIIITNNIKLKVKFISYTFMWLIYDSVPTTQQNSLFDRLIIFDIPILYYNKTTTDIIKCKKPSLITTLSDLIDKSVEDELSNLDINLALQHLSSKNIQPEHRILDKVLAKLKTSLNTIIIKENFLNELVDDNQKEKRLENILSKKRTVEHKIFQIQQRITSNELCFICYSDINTKTVMKCCLNVVCFVCINKWLYHVNKCPLCKIDNPDFYVQQNKHIPSKDILSISKENTIFENFIVLIKTLYNDDDHFTLILGTDDSYIQKFEMIMDNLNLQYIQLKGNSFLFKKYATFKNKILTMNSKRYEYGVKNGYVSDIIILNDAHVNTTLLQKCVNSKTIWKLTYL